MTDIEAGVYISSSEVKQPSTDHAVMAHCRDFAALEAAKPTLVTGMKRMVGLHIGVCN